MRKLFWLSFLFATPIYAAPIVPNFQQGVLNQRVETKSTIVEDIKSYDILNKVIKSDNIIIDNFWFLKNFTTIVKLNICAFRGYNCILYWLVKLITEFLTFQ